jgi:hypothetical protein
MFATTLPGPLGVRGDLLQRRVVEHEVVRVDPPGDARELARRKQPADSGARPAGRTVQERSALDRLHETLREQMVVHR